MRGSTDCDSSCSSGSRVGLGTHRSVCNSSLAGAGCVGATDNGRPGQRSQAEPHSHMGHKIETLARCASGDNLCRLRCLELIIIFLSFFLLQCHAPKDNIQRHAAVRHVRGQTPS